MARSSASCPRSAQSSLFSTPAPVFPEGPHLPPWPQVSLTTKENWIFISGPASHSASPRTITHGGCNHALPPPSPSGFPFSVSSLGTTRQPVSQPEKPALIFHFSRQPPSASFYLSSAKQFSARFLSSCLCHRPSPALTDFCLASCGPPRGPPRL